MASLIDKLPQEARQKVIDALLAGKSLRKVASLAGISHTQVAEYKRKVFLPTLQASQKINAIKALAETPEDQLAIPANLTRAALAADPILSRIAAHQERVDRSLQSAESKEDARGVASLVSTDLKGLELQARHTGRFDAPQAVAPIQVVIPTRVEVQVHNHASGTAADQQTIEIGLAGGE